MENTTEEKVLTLEEKIDAWSKAWNIPLYLEARDELIKIYQ